MWIEISSAVDIHYPQAQNYMSGEEKHLAKNINITPKFSSLCLSEKNNNKVNDLKESNPTALF